MLNILKRLSFSKLKSESCSFKIKKYWNTVSKVKTAFHSFVQLKSNFEEIILNQLLFIIGARKMETD